MPGDKTDIEAFLEEMVSVLEKRFREHDSRLERLEKALSSSGLKIDKSVLRVLRGE